MFYFKSTKVKRQWIITIHYELPAQTVEGKAAGSLCVFSEVTASEKYDTIKGVKN